MAEVPPKRRYRLGETKYVAEYLRTFYPEAIHISPVRLGSPPEPMGEGDYTEEERRMLMVYQRQADAVAILDNRLILIEGKLLPARYPEGLAKLEIYRDLIPHTLSLQPYLDRRIEVELVTPIEDPTIAKLCHQKGFRNPIYRPIWFEEYIKSWFPRWKRPSTYD